MSSRFRRLRPDEKPDRTKGDQFQDQGNGYWILTYFLGLYTVRQLHEGCGDRPAIYRRPKVPRPTDLDEHTATST